MIITLPPQLESALDALARQRGVSAETLVLDLLRMHFLPVAPRIPADEWERRLFAAGVDCGVSVSPSYIAAARFNTSRRRT